MPAIHLVGTADTKAEELEYLATLLRGAGRAVVTVDVGTREPGCAVDVSARSVAAHHPIGANHVLGCDDRGRAMSAMAQAFAGYCGAQKDEIAGIIGIGGGGGASVVTAGMRVLPYGLPKLMVSTLAGGDVTPFVGTSDIIMMPSVTDIAGLNRISRHILHNAAQAIIGMTATPYVAESDAKPAVGLSMFGVTTPCVMQINRQLRAQYDCVVFHATGTGGRSLEQLLAEGMLDGLIDITLTEIADELVGGVLSAGPGRLDAVIASGAPWVGSVGALDMVNFWAPETVPPGFADRLFHYHNDNVTLMRTTPKENDRIGRWIGEKLNRAPGEVRLLLPEGGISALDVEGGAFWDPEADAALFRALEETITPSDHRLVMRVPHHINAPAFSDLAARTFNEIA